VRRGEFGDLRISSLLFADNVVLLATSDLQHAPGQFAAECEVVGMRVSTSKSEARLSIYRSIYVPTLTYGHKLMIELMMRT